MPHAAGRCGAVASCRQPSRLLSRAPHQSNMQAAECKMQACAAVGQVLRAVRQTDPPRRRRGRTPGSEHRFDRRRPARHHARRNIQHMQRTSGMGSARACAPTLPSHAARAARVCACVHLCACVLARARVWAVRMFVCACFARASLTAHAGRVCFAGRVADALPFAASIGAPRRRSRLRVRRRG
jgi:hypothetical protein